MKKIITAAMLFVTAASAAVSASAAEYKDVPDGFWATEAIDYCTENGIMTGVGDDCFAPFYEVDEGTAETVLYRIVNGIGIDVTDTADKTDSIERDETAKAITDALGMKAKGELLINYTDSGEISEDCLWSVNQCVKLGFMQGKGDGIFDPNGGLTRAELSIIAKRVDEYMKSDFEVVNIIHTNDKHGYDIGGSSNIGLDEIAALKENTENAILADDGDSVQGKDFASLTQGKSVIEAMNLAGYDVMSAGNHEFDYGQDVIKNLAADMDFPIISANTEKDGAAFFKGTYSDGEKENNGENCIIDANGIKVGFFGILTTETKTATKPTGTVGITFGDELTETKEQIAALKAQGADVIVGMFHVGTESANGTTSVEIAEMLDENSDIDAIIDGHSHTVYNMRNNGILIAQTGSYLANVGIMTIKIDKDGNVLTSEKLLDTETVKNMNISDTDVKAYLDAEQEENTELLSVRIADTKTALWGGSVDSIAVARITETNLGDLICDAMIEETKDTVSDEYSGLPVVAIENGGGIRSTIYNGEITRGDVFDVLPFANTLHVKLATAKTLCEILERGVSSVSGQDAENGMITSSVSGGFLQIGGMAITYTAAGDAGNKIQSVVLTETGETLDRNDDETKILIAMNDYIAAGGGGYTEAAELTEIMQGTDLEKITEDYILSLTENGEKPLEYPMTDGRITALSDYDGRDYTVSFYLKDEDGELLKNTTASITLDTDYATIVESDDNGIAKLTLKSGAHAVSAGGEETYFCNFSGVGIYTSDGDYKVDYPTVTVK